MNQFFRFYLSPDLYSEYIYTFNNDQANFNYEKFMAVFRWFK